MHNVICNKDDRTKEKYIENADAVQYLAFVYNIKQMGKKLSVEDWKEEQQKFQKNVV